MQHYFQSSDFNHSFIGMANSTVHLTLHLQRSLIAFTTMGWSDQWGTHCPFSFFQSNSEASGLGSCNLQASAIGSLQAILVCTFSNKKLHMVLKNYHTKNGARYMPSINILLSKRQSSPPSMLHSPW